MKVELISIDKVIPYARNPRHNEQGIAKVAGSIKEFGFRQPIVVDKNMVVVVGHTRLLAAERLRFKEVPIHIAESLTETQIKAYRLADNRTHEEVSWNEELLSIEFDELKNANFDLNITGFDENELEKLFVGESIEGLTDEDSIPDFSEETITKPGDLWICGNHRLLCGDATDKNAIKKVLAGSLADMVFTDPPYNVNYGASLKDKLRKNRLPIKNDNLGNGFYDFLFKTCNNILEVCKGAVYICMASGELDTLQKAFRKAGGHWSTFIIWAKNTFTIGRADYQRQYESILYGWKEDNKHYWCGDRNQSDVWFFDRPIKNDLHPTMKPVSLVERAIQNSSKSRDIVLDCFGGSGTTMIACEKIGRMACIIELEPKYCDVIIKRWQEFTGKEATLEK